MDAFAYVELLLFLAGGLIGAFLYALYSRVQHQGSDALQAAEIARCKERMEAQDSELTSSSGQLEALHAQLDAERETTRALEKRLTAAETRAEQIALLSQRLETSEKQRENLASESRNLSAQLASSEEKLQQLVRTEQRLEQKEGAVAELQEQKAALEAEIARLETTLREEREQNTEKLQLLQQAREQLRLEFENLANKIFEEKSQKFTEQNQVNVAAVLNPLRDQLTNFHRKVEDVYDKESKERHSLLHEITKLKDLNQQISKDAINLTNALKGETKTQGNWGEMILERVLEQSGLTKGREYEVQGKYVDEAGRRLHPDVIVHLPEQKDVVIDSKVSLVAYERYCRSDDEAERAKALSEHIASMRAHIKGLSAKSYEDLVGLRSLDFVLMFVPIEAAFILAVEHEQNLFGDAFNQNIVVVSPSTLLATLRTIEHIWRYEYQNRNAQEIAKQAGNLYDKFVGFVEALEDIGDKLGKAQLAYETARGRLAEGKGNLVGRVEALKRLGAKSKKDLPPDYILQVELSESTG